MIQVAIDGPAGCGKSTTAKEVARRLGFLYVDSGAMYRAVTLYFIENQIDEAKLELVKNTLEHIELDFLEGKITLNGQVAEPQIRSLEVSKKVSQVAAIGLVRDFLVARQRQISKNQNVIMDGRDIGTVVFPQAALKIFMVADSEVRAKRRQQELLYQGQNIDIEKLKKDIETRDLLDSTRSHAPLRKAEQAIELDTTHMSFEEQVNFVVSLIENKLANHDCNH